MMSNIPQILYKYRNWDDNYHKKVLTNCEVFLASPANLNDPFDASLPFRYNPEELTPGNITQKLLETGRKEWPNISEQELHERAFNEQYSGRFDDDGYWKEMHEATKADLHNKFGLLSMAKQNDDLLMWAHYANCHKGFCVGIDSKLLYESIGGTIGPVTYLEKFPFMSIFGSDEEQVKTMIRMLNTKSTHWKYENEFRLSKAEASNKAFILPPEAITEVVLGCNMSENNRKSIIAVVDAQLPKAQISEARTSLESFKLDILKTIRI